MIMAIILFITIFIFISCLSQIETEQMATSKNAIDTANTIKNEPIAFEEIEKEKMRNNSSADIFNNSTFNDVVIYDNNIDGRLGLDKCMEIKKKNNGTCVPFGITGVAYYYPPRDVLSYSIVGESLLTKSEKKESKEGFESFPNLRWIYFYFIYHNFRLQANVEQQM